MYKSIFGVVIISLILIGCKGYGKKLEFNGGELFYTKTVTLDEAERLGNFLVEQDFFAGDKISVQIDRIDDVYIFKMVSKEGVEENAENITMAQSFVITISQQVFDGAPVNFHFCDEYFETKLEVPFPITSV